MNRRNDAINAEIEGEKASSLGRTGQQLRAALDALAAHADADEKRAKLLAAAAEAFWFYIVQREAMGLHDAEYIGKQYGVPDEVWRHMGPSKYPRDARKAQRGLEFTARSA